MLTFGQANIRAVANDVVYEGTRTSYINIHLPVMVSNIIYLTMYSSLTLYFRPFSRRMLCPSSSITYLALQVVRRSSIPKSVEPVQGLATISEPRYGT